MTTTVQTDVRDVVVVHAPFKRGLPPMRAYSRDMWARRQFFFEMTRSQVRSQHLNTALGALWLVVNPLLLSLVYFLLYSVISQSKVPDELSRITAGLFAFYFFMNSVNAGATSVVKGGRLISNTAFPKALLPLTAVAVAFWKFLPTLPVLAVIFYVQHVQVSWRILWALPVFLVLLVFSVGVTFLFAALNVYFRDTASFLPYMLRIWLYLSPVLYPPDISGHAAAKALSKINPMWPIMGNWVNVVYEGEAANLRYLAVGSVWAIAALVIGSWFFLSRERDFAIRI